MCTAAVSCGGMHPGALWGGTLLPQGTLLLLHTPAAFKPGVCLQTHPAAVPHGVTLVQVGCGDRSKRTGNKDGVSGGQCQIPSFRMGRHACPLINSFRISETKLSSYSVFESGRNYTQRYLPPLSRCRSIAKSHWSRNSLKATLYQLLAAKCLSSNIINI